MSLPFWLSLPLSLVGAFFSCFLFLSFGVRLVMTSFFLFVEYNRPVFPVDVYGFSNSERFNYASEVLAFLIEGRGSEQFYSLVAPSGSALFNVREAVHLLDVSALVHMFFLWSIASLFCFCGLLTVSCWLLTIRIVLREALRWACYITIGTIIIIVANAILNWDFFFTAFHRLFFSEGTWLFEYSDSLIRLFPEQFWFDAAVTVGIVSICLSIFTLLVIIPLPYWKNHPQRTR